ETFRFIRDNHPDIDYIIWTGDIPAHDIWNQTKESQLQLITIASDLFDKYFGHIPIYPVVGNHESLPMNRYLSFDPHSFYNFVTVFLNQKSTESIRNTGSTTSCRRPGSAGCRWKPVPRSKGS